MTDIDTALAALGKTSAALAADTKHVAVTVRNNAAATLTLAKALAAAPVPVPTPDPPPATGNPVPPPATGTLFGVYANGDPTYVRLYGGKWSNAPLVDPGTQDALARFEQNAGKQVALVMFGWPDWLTSDIPAAELAACHARGAIPVVDMSTEAVPLALKRSARRGAAPMETRIAHAKRLAATAGSVVSGAYDAKITENATRIAALGYPVVLRLDAEMNGTWYDYGAQARLNPALFVSMWRHVHALFEAAGATNVSWHWCPQADVQDPGWPLTPLWSLYPGDDVVDWTGMTDYSHAVNERWDWLFAYTYAQLMLIAPSKPIMIGEVASVAASRAQFLADMFAKLPTTYPNVRGFVWFNWWNADQKAVPEEWPIESAALPQFKAGIASSRYVGRP